MLKKMNVRSFIRIITLILLRTLQRFDPMLAKETPALSIIYLAAVILTILFFGSWIFTTFNSDYFSAMISLWGIHLFMNVCEATGDVRSKLKQDKKSML